MSSQHRWNPRVTPRRVVLPVPLDPTGREGPTPGSSRGREWRRSSHGFFVPSHVDGSVVEQRIAETAPLVGEGAVTGWAALRMHGGTFFDGLDPDGRTELPVPVVLRGAPRRPRDGVVFGRDRLDEDEVVSIQGMRCTAPRRALFDQMRSAGDLREAVVAMDMAAAARITSIARMARYVDGRSRWRGVDQVRRALALADEDSRSPQETRMRLVWVLDAKLPRPRVNVPVFTRDGALVGYPDLLDVEAGLACEYDGEDHRRARRHSSDVDREAVFRGIGIEVTRATGADVRHPPKLVARMTEARGRALFLPASRRSWTLEPPEDWTFELPLDVELDLRGEQC